ncbi:MAG: methyltransferase domain-containing protein [Elusimicrobia bacterium]|nr:methyltransferase domain-containing protein [Elusimicrobiota bacterium]
MSLQIPELKDSLVLHRSRLDSFEREGIHFFIDGGAPNWIAVDQRGARLLEWVDGRKTLGEIFRLYNEQFVSDAAKAWRDLHVFVRQAMAKGMLHAAAQTAPPYPGRGEALEPKTLNELWIHLLQTCNLACSHCLVSSGPGGEKGLGRDFYLGLIDQGFDLGVRRFYFTGGEPFIREDIFDLIRYTTEDKKAQLMVLTNATLFSGPRLEALKTLDRERLNFQVSLDGCRPETNDPIRGAGVFAKASAGLKTLNELGFATSLTAAVTKSNVRDLEQLPKLAKELGAKSVHLMWLHKRGRILETDGSAAFPTHAELAHLARTVKAASKELGVIVDNAESFALRVNGLPGVKYDLGNCCWESLCVYMDGKVYPSAAMAGYPALALGDAEKEPLRKIWMESPVARAFRNATVGQKKSLSGHPFRFLTGGGDIEHSYFFDQAGVPAKRVGAEMVGARQSGNDSANGHEGSLMGEDPYHELYVELMKDAMFDLASTKKAALNLKSGFNPPVIYHAMGEGQIASSQDAALWLDPDGAAVKVKLTHSNCVLSFDVEKPYKIIQNFYGKAALAPQKELCCPVKYDESEVGHIPREVLDRFYGCGSPVTQAGLKAGETMLDLGSGAGIDCFIAAKKVGPTGRVIGVDMTQEMLTVARQCKNDVAAVLGYDVVEFRDGYLENIPAETASVDLVTSNCVINLSPDKNKVFAEIWRVLKDTGRMVVADIVADRPVPLALAAHQDLWGECISGSLSEEEFLTALERAGFYGIRILKKTFWKEVKAYQFHSLTVQAFKFEKKAGCRFMGQQAVYLGPYKAAMDEEGHLFPRGESIEICTDTAAKLRSGAYAGQFLVYESDGSQAPAALPMAVAANDGCCEGGACC